MQFMAWQIQHRKTNPRVMRCLLNCVNAVERDPRSEKSWKISPGAVSTPSLCLNPVRALQHGMVRELYGDATHKMSHHLINRRQMSVDDVSGGSHLWGIMFQPHGTESGDHYKQVYIMQLTRREDSRLCDDCQCCNTIRGVSV